MKSRVWLWLVVLGTFLLVVGSFAAITGETSWLYALLGLSNLMVGLSLRTRQK